MPPANAIEKSIIIAGGDGEKASLPLIAHAPYYNIFLPAAELLRRGLSKPFCALGRKLRMDDRSFAALLVGFVSATPAIRMIRETDERGKTMNAAFLVCGASALDAHLGFTMAVERSMLLPLLLTKLVGGLMGAALALFLTRKSTGNAPVS